MYFQNQLAVCELLKIDIIIKSYDTEVVSEALANFNLTIQVKLTNPTDQYC